MQILRRQRIRVLSFFNERFSQTAENAGCGSQYFPDILVLATCHISVTSLTNVLKWNQNRILGKMSLNYERLSGFLRMSGYSMLRYKQESPPVLLDWHRLVRIFYDGLLPERKDFLISSPIDLVRRVLVWCNSWVQLSILHSEAFVW